jgi:hypothetical protein
MMWWRATLAWVLLALSTTACLPTGPMQPPEARPAVGPELALDVVNQSNRPAVVGYEFEEQASSGGGEGEVLPCRRDIFVFGSVGGEYEIIVNRDVVAEGRLPGAIPQEGYLVVRIVIDPDGVATAGEPRWTRMPPDQGSQPLAGCG